MKTLNEHPEKGTRVIIHFKNTSLNVSGNRDGIWTGSKWLIRKVYTKGEYEAVPKHIELTGWEPLERDPYSK